MNSSQLWQHPFVDVFKYVNLNDWKLAQKEGDISECLDRVTGKRVLKLQGSISAANYIQVPRVKGKLKNLGLTGRYLYVQFHVPPSKFFAMHFDYILQNSKTRAEEPLRVSFSNLFKETKLAASGLQVATHLSEKWTVLCADIMALCHHHIGIHITSHTLRSLMVCSHLVIRGVFTSDILYTSATLPREMSFKLAAQGKWEHMYDWLTAHKDGKEATRTKVKQEENKILDLPLEDSSNKHVSFVDLPVKSHEPRPEILLQPDPIMQLSSVIGYSGSTRSNIKWTRFGTDLSNFPPEFVDGSYKFLIYPAGAVIVLLNPVTKRQCFLKGHTAAVSCLTISEDGTLLASGQVGNDPKVLLWNLGSTRPTSASSSAPSFTSFPSSTSFASFTLDKMNGLKALSFSHDNKMIAAAATDSFRKDAIAIYSVRKMPKLIIKQQSNYHINALKFSPLHSDRLVSCGKENIRFWRINKDALSGGAVVLSHHSRTSEFMDLDFEVFTSSTKSPEIDEHLKRVFVTSDQGILFQINYKSMEIEGAFQLHEGSIDSVAVCEGFCVTGSADNYLRVWALDFSEYILEAHHEAGGIAGVDITPDGLFVVCGTGSSAVGVLDMAANTYKTVVRAHRAPVVDMDVHPNGEYVITASQDGTMRLWSARTFEETHEFTSTEDAPLALSFHPELLTFACGFESGTMLVFEVFGTQALLGRMQHEFPIRKVCHSNDKQFLVSISSDATTCIYAVEQEYAPIKTVPVQSRGSFVDVCFSANSEFLAVLGIDGLNVCVLSARDWKVKHRVTMGEVRQIAFARNDLVGLVVGTDCRIKTYSVEGKFKKEMSRLHRSAEITGFLISPNGKYLVTGGSDRAVKVWNNACKAADSRCQVFPGHSASLKRLKFSADSSRLLSVASDSDGVFVWDFYGDRGAGNLELSQNAGEAIDTEEAEETQEAVESQELEEQESVQLKRVVGFNADEKHNLIWVAEQGWFLHTSGNLIVQTLLRQGSTQAFFRTPLSFVNKIAITPDAQYLACSGVQETQEAAHSIYIFSVPSRDLVSELKFHNKPVGQLAFSSDGRYLLSFGHSEKAVVIWNWRTSKVIASSYLESQVSQIQWVPETHEFVSVGSEVTQWRLAESRLECCALKILAEAQEMFTSIEIQSNIAYIGSNIGRLNLVNLDSGSTVASHIILGSQITCISASSERTTLGGDSKHILSFTSQESLARSQEALELDGYITGISMEPSGNEGIVSTTGGTIWYVNWSEQKTIRIAATHMPCADILGLTAGPLIASSSTDLVMRLWEPVGFNEVLHETSQKSECLCLSFHPMRSLLVAGFADGSIKFYDVASVKLIGKSKVFSSGVRAMAWQGSHLLVGSCTGLLNKLSCSDWSYLNISIEEIGSTGGAVLSIDVRDQLIMASSDTGKVTVWDQNEVVDVFNLVENPHGDDDENLEFTHKLYQSLQNIQCYAVFLSEHVIACAASPFQYVYLKEILGEVRRAVIPYFPSSIALIHKTLVVGTTEGQILLFNCYQENFVVVQGHSHKITAITPTVDGFISGASCQLMCWKLNHN